MNIRKLFFRLISILILQVMCNFAYGADNPSSLPKLIVFHSPSCHRCVKAKNEVIPAIEKEFKDKIVVEYRDIDISENYMLLLSLKEKYKSKIEISLPVFFMEGRFSNGKGNIKDNLLKLIPESLALVPNGVEGLTRVDLVQRFKSFEPLAVISAGLIDGINPCAFTVIVFFISFLALQGYRKKELIPIGLTFIFAVFLTYLLIGIGIFGFLYQLQAFWLVTKIINFSIGLFSIFLGILSAFDFVKFKKTKETEGLFLQLPKAVKDRIHSVIGLHYRQSKEADGSIRKAHVFKLLLSALITGCLVSILEAVCTGQVYLPTITFVLKTSHLRLQALGYLLLYNLMFILPLLLIFLLALLGVTSEEFSRFLKKNLGFTKILMAILFFGLGIFLIWRA